VYVRTRKKGGSSDYVETQTFFLEEGGKRVEVSPDVDTTVVGLSHFDEDKNALTKMLKHAS
jgi:hypothetical protein